MDNWKSFLKYDPLPWLQSTINPAIHFFIDQDLLGYNNERVESLWTIPSAIKIIQKQLPDGSWLDKAHKKHIGSPTNYRLVEVYRTLGILIECYGFNKSHPAIQKAAEFIFNTQTEEGDFRGMYGIQYMPNYTGGLLELLVKAGYIDDPHIQKCFEWFLKNRQDDGGWALPVLTRNLKLNAITLAMNADSPISADRARPFSHFITGNVLRAFAVHPTYRLHPDAIYAANLLVHRLFKPDIYSSRKAASYWTRYSFPFWWSDLISVLDSLSLMKLSPKIPEIENAINYFQVSQTSEGYWNLYLLKNATPDMNYWLNLLVCRILKRFLG